MILKSSLTSVLPDASSAGQALPLKAEGNNRQAELWLAMHLPRLALETVTAGGPPRALVVVEERGKRQFVQSASPAAEQLGISSGMDLGAAYALCTELQTREPDLPAQQQVMQDLASWALQFSPRISLCPPCSLLLEVAGSIRYFGSLDAIQAAFAEGFRQRWKHHFHMAISPVAEASLLLARSSQQLVIRDLAGLRSALGKLPLSVLPVDKKRTQQLEKTGLRVLRDLWRLPPAALARRFGPELPDYLDRALGKRPDPVTACRAALRFQSSCDIPSAVQNYQLLSPYIYQLLDELCIFLRQSDTCASNLVFYFKHRKQLPSIIDIELRQALRESAHFMMLLETKLQRQKMRAPVIAIELVVETLHASTAKTPDLFTIEANAGNDIDTLLEQLHARLGYDAVRGLIFQEDHRPEQACLYGSLEMRAYPRIEKPRPLWLLAEPKPLLEKDRRLYYRELIHFSRGPERIESGWWDGMDIRRDYYIGIDATAGSLWIFHDLRDRQLWYLHGLFG